MQIDRKQSAPIRKQKFGIKFFGPKIKWKCNVKLSFKFFGPKIKWKCNFQRSAQYLHHELPVRLAHRYQHLNVPVIVISHSGSLPMITRSTILQFFGRIAGVTFTFYLTESLVSISLFISQNCWFPLPPLHYWLQSIHSCSGTSLSSSTPSPP